MRKEVASILMTPISHPGRENEGGPVSDEEAVPAHGTSNDTSPDSTNLVPQSPSTPSCKYVLLRTPKKLGEQLVPDDRDTPEAWVCSIHLIVNLTL